MLTQTILIHYNRTSVVGLDIGSFTSKIGLARWVDALLLLDLPLLLQADVLFALSVNDNAETEGRCNLGRD